MKILQVSAEIYPLLKTGGLADVTGALPGALAAIGGDVRVVLPGFESILADLRAPTVLAELTAPWGERVVVRQGHLVQLGVWAYVIDVPAFYQRPGSPYADAEGLAYADNDRRFALLGWIASRLADGLDILWQPKVVHAHDWHAALTCAYMAFLPPRRERVACIYTVHNLAYQGLFARKHLLGLGLPNSAFAIDGLEFHGQISFMKAGLFYADHITTVSPTYAREICTFEQGCGLDGLLRVRAEQLTGILNGVDDTVWDPSHDSAIETSYEVGNLAGKARCKAALQRELGLAVASDALLFGVVSRLTEHKGLHLVLAELDELVARGGQLVVLGSGDSALELAFAERAAAAPLAVAVRLGYDERLAHRIFAATDVTLVPSRFEPCGLTQMYGLKYGSLPLVHRVGGLADTVVDCSLEDLAEETANGFVFDRFDSHAFSRAMARAFALHRVPAQWRVVQQRAMRQNLGWGPAATQYMALYQQLCR